VVVPLVGATTFFYSSYICNKKNVSKCFPHEKIMYICKTNTSSIEVLEIKKETP